MESRENKQAEDSLQPAPLLCLPACFVGRLGLTGSPAAPLASCCLFRAVVSLPSSVRLCVCASLCRQPFKVFVVPFSNVCTLLPSSLTLGALRRGPGPQLCSYDQEGGPLPCSSSPPPFQLSPAPLPIPKEEQSPLLQRVGATRRAQCFCRTHQQLFTDLIFSASCSFILLFLPRPLSLPSFLEATVGFYHHVAMIQSQTSS